MKVLMIAPNDLESTASLGVVKKLKGEYRAFRKIGADAYFLTSRNGEVVLLHGEDQRVLFPVQKNGYLAAIRLYGSAASICKEYGIDLCYIRYSLADWMVMRMIRKLHRICKVYMEIPTYPYDGEAKGYTNPVARFNYMQDRRNRRYLHRYADRIVTFSDDREIFGIPCIGINNGIDVESVRYVGDDLDDNGDITLISVALMRPIHGYDRVIAGLARYYDQNPKPEVTVRYLIVGNGPDTEHLQRMVQENRLERYVEFCGKQSGQKLDDLFRRSNIGVAVLAGHREGHKSVSDLKSREYCARGIPFITANDDKAIPKDSPFMKLVPMNDDPLDIEEMIRYFEDVKGQKDIHRICREYAECHFCWEYQLERVIREWEEEVR